MMRTLKMLLVSGLLVMAAGAALAAEGDIVFKQQGGEGGTAVVVFPHWIHRIRYKCYACHDGIFKMKQGENAVTMDGMREGKFCGTCHDGKTAWGITFETCNRCHVGR